MVRPSAPLLRVSSEGETGFLQHRNISDHLSAVADTGAKKDVLQTLIFLHGPKAL
jgi:hypothetical protein